MKKTVTLFILFSIQIIFSQNNSKKYYESEILETYFKILIKKKLVKDQFESTLEFKERIENLKPKLDSIIYEKLNYYLINNIDDQGDFSTIEFGPYHFFEDVGFKLLDYNADLSKYQISLPNIRFFTPQYLIFEEDLKKAEEDYMINKYYNKILLFDSDAGVLYSNAEKILLRKHDKLNLYLDVDSKVAKSIYENKDRISYSFTNWKIVDKCFVPNTVNIYFNKDIYQLNNLFENYSTIIFNFKFDNFEYTFNFDEFSNKLNQNKIDKERKIQEEKIKILEEKKRKEEENKKIEQEKKQKEEKDAFFKSNIGKRALKLKMEFQNYISNKKFTLEEITTKFNILKDSILNEEIEINGNDSNLSDIRNNYFCKLNNYIPLTEELKLEYYKFDLQNIKFSDFIFVKWKKDNYEQIKKIVNTENSSPFLMVPMTAKLINDKFHVNQFLILIQPLKKVNIIDIYSESYTKQFSVDLKKEGDKYLLKCRNRNILEYFSLNEMEEPVILYDYMIESKGFTKIPKKATYLLLSNNLDNKKYENITLEFLEIDINKNLKN